MKLASVQRVVGGGILGSVLLLSPGLMALQKNPVEASPENVAKGQAIYKKHCQMCHGEKGIGDGPAGKRLNPKPQDFTDKERMASKTDEYLFKDITKGEGPMPSFERKLKEEERWMVIHYIRTFSGTGEK
jgi:mono/diheme cytochrome c family protein